VRTEIRNKNERIGIVWEIMVNQGRNMLWDIKVVRRRTLVRTCLKRSVVYVWHCYLEAHQ
jgi:hypothetical protein